MKLRYAVWALAVSAVITFGPSAQAKRDDDDRSSKKKESCLLHLVTPEKELKLNCTRG